MQSQNLLFNFIGANKGDGLVDEPCINDIAN